MKLLVTGSTGFIVKNLVEFFQKKNGFQIFSPNEYELDLTNSLSVERYLSEIDCDVIVHSATTLRTNTSYPVDVCEKNLKMFFNLVRYKREHVQIINLGSGSEYSRAHWHQKMSEDFFDNHVPEDSHSYSKYLISKYINNCKELNAVTLRLFGIFGKYEDYRYKFISNCIAKNLVGLPIVINQDARYDYLCIEDFCEILKKLLSKSLNFRSYNVTPTLTTSLQEIAHIVNQHSYAKSNILINNEGIGVEYSGNNERLLSEISPFAFTDIQYSIKSLYDYYRRDLHSISKSELEEDLFLEYAKNLKLNYFEKNNEK